MDTFYGVMLFIAVFVGFIQGLTDKRPSFWRGFGEGMAGRGKIHGDTYLFFNDPRTGLGMGMRIDDD